MHLNFAKARGRGGRAARQGRGGNGDAADGGREDGGGGAARGRGGRAGTRTLEVEATLEMPPLPDPVAWFEADSPAGEEEQIADGVEAVM